MSGVEGQRLLGSEGCEDLAGPALTLPGGDAVEVVVHRTALGVARFARSTIHQSVATDDLRVNVRVATPDGRVGVASAGTSTHAGVRTLAEQARAIAAASPADPDFPGLAPAAAVPTVPFDPRLLQLTPADRAATVRTVLAGVAAGGAFEAAGAYATRVSEIAVLTTAGQRAYTRLSGAHLSVVVAGRGSGYAEAGGRSLADVDPEHVTATAVAKATAAEDPAPVDAGVWPVVLEPAAVATLVQYLAWLGFGGKAYEEGRTFTAGRMGQRVVSRAVSVADDALAPGTAGPPMDLEGTPKQRVPLLADGVVAGVVHDRRTARRAGTTSTGHGLLAPNPDGPIALQPVMAPGPDGSVASLIGGLERGLLVTRLHYTNVVEPLRTVVTGMTRDGTFLVEDGRVVRPVHNLRFTQSILDALTTVDAVSSEVRYTAELGPGGGRSPALRLPAFRFTGTTDFG